MNYEDLKWINQSLFSHKDKSYDSHGYLDLSVSINTSDDVSFSQPKLVFNLDNQGQRRNVRLTYLDTKDLVKAINGIKDNLKEIYSNPQPGDITRRYNQDKDLVFEFRMLPNANIPLVVIRIVHNHSDEGKIIIPLSPVFEGLVDIIKMFEENFVKFSLDLPSRYLQSLSVNKLNSIETLIKILPTHFSNIQPQNSRREKTPDIIPYKGEEAKMVPAGTRCAMCGEEQFETPSGVTCKNGHGGADSVDIEQNEFEKFSEENIDSVRIPELEVGTTLDKIEPVKQTVHSPFISQMLKGNILNLEKMIIALTTNNNPLLTIMDTLHKGQPYKLLPGISEQDLKSTVYVSNIFFKTNLQSYVQNQTGFPLGIPVVKYKGEDVDRDTIELSYDLLMINAYLKLYRNRMEAINSDPYTNGAIIHFAFRCWLDISTYSYLNQTNSAAVKNCVLTRFNSFRESGFFDYYDNLLAKNMQKTISVPEVAEFLDKVFNSVVDSENIDKKHFSMHDVGSVKLPPKNDFTLEQITNEIIKYEVKVLFGQRIEDLTTDDNITTLFNTRLQKKFKQTDHRPEPRAVETHVLRYIKLKANEIPERFRNDFVSYIEGMENNPYDFNNSPFKIEELNDLSIKALYIWNNFLEDNIKYTDFAVKVEECIDKDLIVAKVKESPKEKTEEKTEASDWMTSFGTIEL